MSRVHEALRRAEQAGLLNTTPAPPPPQAPPRSAASVATPATPPPVAKPNVGGRPIDPALRALLDNVQEIPYNPSPEAHLIDAARPHEAPMEEFRTLRTRLNHLKNLQPLHSVVVTSPSPAEGKSLSAA